MHKVLSVALLGVLAGCVAPREAPPAPPQPRPAPAPPPAPPAPPPSDDWRDIPVTPGTWRYGAEPGGTIARFGAAGAPVLSVRCDLASRTVTIAREGATVATSPVIDITTSAGRQNFRGQVVAGRAAVAASFAARDSFLDKMAFSRGRFIVVVTGMERLAVPSWAELSRVVEDCRG